MTGGPLRRLQELAAGLRSTLTHQASDEGGESGEPPVRVPIDMSRRCPVEWAGLLDQLIVCERGRKTGPLKRAAERTETFEWHHSEYGQ
jgi:hypothetical protein